MPSRRRRKVGGALTDADLVFARAIAEVRDAEELARPVGRRTKMREATRSTAFRNRGQLAPQLIAVLLIAVAALVQLVSSAFSTSIGRSGVVLPIVLIAAVITVLIVRSWVPKRWRARGGIAVLVAATWLVWTLRVELTWTGVGVLALAVVVLSARWWQAIRHPHPAGPPVAVDKPNRDPARPDRENIAGLWNAYIGSRDGALAGASLHSRITDDHRESYTVELVPGKHSLDKALSGLDRIQSGLRRPQEEIILERHPSGDSAQLKLTVVTRSPIKTAVIFDGPKYFHEGSDGWIEPGRYADGEGRVRVSLYAANSARHLVIFGGQGSGKTALLNQMAVSAHASGHTTIFYLDGQDGASSPQLMRYADWAPTGPQRAGVMLDALERIFALRGKLMKARRLAGLNPSAELPGLVVIIDECHLIWQPGSDEIRRWVNLASLARKLGVAFWAATQHPELASFGNVDKLRSLLMQYTTLVLRTTSGVANNILRLEVDPSKLPTLPGYGYLVAGDKADGVRSAPFRADFLDDANGVADTWFEAYPGTPLDKATAKAAGPQYYNRAEIAERQQRELEDDLAAWLGDDETPDLDLVALGNQSSAEGSLELAAVPTFPAPIPAPSAGPAGLTATQTAVWVAVGRGTTRAAHISAAVGLSTSQTYKLLGELVDAGHITKTGHGQYRVVDQKDAT
jgi:hypothetical protein